MMWRIGLIFIILLGGAFPLLAQDALSDEPDGCLRPPDDYTRVMVNGQILNRRTLAMLEHAQTLYGGTIDLTNLAVTQGSYAGGAIALSFGTHDGGGAVDISVRNFPYDWSILWEDIPLVIGALRTAGFAAWYRDESDSMTPHIHAIAIGDAELSRAAALQLTGRYGYFRGFDGLPQADGVPQADEDGEIILCDWMRELGYTDQRDGVAVETPPYNIHIGDRLYVNVLWGEELNLREQPSLNAAILTTLPHETLVTILEGPQFGDGFRWWKLQTERGTIGWAVDAIAENITLVP
jgi:hypothetical protein